jgi:hypothetical protein
LLPFSTILFHSYFHSSELSTSSFALRQSIMARGKKRQVGADAAQGRQPNTRSVKKQRMEEIVIDEEPSAACLRNSEQEEQLPSVRQATGENSTQR